MLNLVVSTIITIVRILTLVAMAVLIIINTCVIITILITFLMVITLLMVRELDLLLSVCGTIDPVDWRQNTVSTHSTHNHLIYAVHTPHI
jgi:hypothetical protein